MSTEIRELARNRVSCRAVALGASLGIGMIFVFMCLAAGFGVWKFSVNDYQGLSAVVWIFTIAATSLSLYVGAYSAAISGRATFERDGRLIGFFTWSLVNVLISFFIYSQVIDFAEFEIQPSMYMAAFLCQIFALMAAFAGGAAGAKSERGFEARVLESRRLQEKARLNEASPSY